MGNYQKMKADEALIYEQAMMIQEGRSLKGKALLDEIQELEDRLIYLSLNNCNEYLFEQINSSMKQKTREFLNLKR